MKFIYTHCWGDEGCSGTSYISFEYSSKEEFVFDMLEKFDKVEVFDYYNQEIKLFEDVTISKCDLHNLEGNVKTLDEWFELNKLPT